MQILAFPTRLARAAVSAAALSCCSVASGAFVPATVETAGANVTTNVLSDQSTVVTFLADGTFTVPDGATARLLLVGGGGGAGWDCSGGGGGGGVIETNGVDLAPGTYTVAVGAGGPHRTTTGGPGPNGKIAAAVCIVVLLVVSLLNTKKEETKSDGN